MRGAARYCFCAMHDDGTQQLSTDVVFGASRHAAHLSWSDDAGAHRVRVNARHRVGSVDSADVVVREAGVSRLHCELQIRDDGMWVLDRSATNGTFVQDVRVESARVPNGAVLRLGRVEIRVDYEEETSPIELWPDDHFGPLLGRSTIMRELFARLAKIARAEAPTLVHGETGTGKELVGRALHQHSPRADRAFEVVDCAALPEHLVEAELFGHRRGAFTGAIADRVGAFERADGGTLVLDEIGELPLLAQPKLLRVLESGSVRRVGADRATAVDVRVIACTHRDLIAMVGRGEFREDLYFRLAALDASVPPLRARGGDLQVLIRHFAPEDTDPLLLAKLVAAARTRPFPGNVRELKNFVGRALTLGLESAVQSPRPVTASMQMPPIPFDSEFKDIRNEWMEHLERGYIEEMLRRHGRSLAGIAEASGLDRSYVHRLMRKHDL